MTTVTDVLNRIARQTSVDQPDSWLTATSREHQELRDDFLLETVDEIQERLDLPSPIGRQFELTGDGSETYSLPSDFKRLMRDPMAVYETTTIRRAMLPVTDDGVWTHLKQIGSTGAARYYKIEGYEENHTISIYLEPSASISVTISYVSTRWIYNDSSYKSTFDDPDDALLLPRRLVEAGTVMRWRERNGLPTKDKRLEFEALLERLSNDSRSRRTINFGDSGERVRPWDVPVPDQIPTS